MLKEQSRKTKNNVMIYDYKNPHLHGFFISLYLRAGSMHEDHAGITHFLEHAAIRNVNRIMDEKLYPTLDKLGIEFNASTFTEMVQFYISGATENFDVAAEIIAKLLSPIILSPAEIKNERDRIKAEIRESDDKGSLSNFANNIVHSDTTLANIITGSLGSVEKISAKRLEEYRKSVMTSENIFFYVSGNYSDENLNKLALEIEKYTVKKGVKNENIAPVSTNFGKREKRVHLKNADFTMLRFNFDMDMSRINMAEADLLYDILLCGYNSRFFIEMSEKRGLFYDISGSSERYNNIGSLAFSFEVRGGSIYDAVETTVYLLQQIKTTPPHPDEMMKAGFVTNAYLLYDNPRELNFTFAYDNHILDSSYESVEGRAEKYKSITPIRICEVASEVFRPENLTLAIKGNKKKIDLDKIEEIVKKL
jgi:predicted Zn-dependent peptidase